MYSTLKETFTKSGFSDFNTVDKFPLNNFWRNNPLSDKTTIRSNVAGYYPYKSQLKPVEMTQLKDPEIIYSTELLMPNDYPFNYPCGTIKSKATDLVKSNSINVQP